MISVTTRYAQNAAAAVTSQTKKRHMVAVKQLILIMLVYVISFVPALVALNVKSLSLWYTYLLPVNHVANFFIYLAVNTEFRNEAKNMMNIALKKVRSGKQQTMHVSVLPESRNDQQL